MLKISFLIGGDKIDTIYWLWISKMKYMYFEIFDQLIKRYKSLETIWNLSYNDFVKCEFLNNNQILELSNYDNKKNLEKIVKYMEKNCIGIIDCYQKIYPIKLRNIRNRPIVLFYKGNINLINQKSIGMVGSRACSVYGRMCAEYFANEISKRGINIVSGLAVGIDSIAHIATLNNRGNTIGVMGNGIDSVYPSQNLKIVERILQKNRANYFRIFGRNKTRER